MPSIIQTTVYCLDELPEATKEKARAWYREGGFDYDWFESVYEDFERVCDILGVCLDTTSLRLFGGWTRRKPCIWFSGFWSQGDGAFFEGDYSYAKGASAAIRRYAPKDGELHCIADALGSIQRRNFYQLRARSSHRGRYYHEYSMDIVVERDSPVVQDMTADAEDDVKEALRDLARWLYGRLENEYEHLTSDEAVDEMLRLNEYGFTEDGVRFG